jgi:general secretion pathway protein L
MMSDFTSTMQHLPLAFWRWWRGELQSLWPKRWRARRRLKKPYLLLTIGADQITLKACKRSGEVELGPDGEGDQADLPALGQHRYRRWPILVQIESALGLRKIVDLPHTSPADIDRLLYYELDRLTPFAADDAFLSWIMLDDDVKSGRMKLQLDVVPKAALDHPIGVIRQYGREPKYLELLRDNESDPLELRQGELNEASERQGPSLTLPLVVLGLAILAITIPLYQQDSLIDQLDADILGMRATVEETASLREEMTKLADQANFLVDAKTRRMSMAEIVAALTRLIPDHGYISQLQIRDGKVTLVGHADKASDLIASLAGSSVFARPRFDSPVTKDRRTTKERFQISAEVTGGPR